MIGVQEIERRFNEHVSDVQPDSPELLTHQTLVAQYKGFANYIDVALVDGPDKDQVVEKLEESSRIAHASLIEVARLKAEAARAVAEAEEAERAAAAGEADEPLPEPDPETPAIEA